MNKNTHTSEFYYTAEPIYKKVSKQEYIDFIKKYPRLLERDVFGACDPPYVTYNDFELANRWPYSIVADTYLYDDEPNKYYYEPEESRTYRILINYKECFNSKTGNKAGPNE